MFSFAYYYLVLPLVAANALAWLVAVTGSYVMNSTITFAARIRPQACVPRATSTFALSQIAGIVANTGDGVVPGRAMYVPAWAAKVAAILVSFVVNFSLSHFVVFRRARSARRHVDRWRRRRCNTTTT